MPNIILSTVSTKLNYYNIDFDIAALCIAVVVIIEFTIRSTIGSRQTKAFSRILIFGIIAVVFDLASSFALPYYLQLPHWFNHLLLTCYNLSFHGLSAMYLHYVIVTLKNDEERITTKEKVMIVSPYAVDVFMVVTNFFTGLLYTIDETTGEYKSNFGVYISYLIGAVYLLMAISFFFFKRKNLTAQAKVIISTYSVIIATTMLIQAIFPELLLMMFGVMIALLLMTFTLESPAYYEEQQLGIYNRFAFQTMCSNYIGRGKQFAVLGLRLDGLMDLRELVGITNVSVTLKDVSKFLLSIAGRKNTFSISESQFALIIEGGESEIEMMINKIQKRFDEVFDVNNEKVHLTVFMSRFSFPRDAQSTEAVMDLLEYSLIKPDDMGKDAVVIANSNLLEEKQRMTKILQILKRALTEGRFSIYYQPIYSVEFQRFTSAEALLRLYDDDYGFISPDEFVPIAEKNGLMVKIGEYVFREVCRFMTTNRIWEKGIDYIDVNISTMQCLQEDLANKLTSIMDEFKMDYGRISLEITETANALSNRYFRDNMQQLINKGMRFSLDDYGTGFANLTTVVEYPFSIVKLDKRMLWSAMKNDKAMVVLRQTIRMMKQLSLELIAEGVETDEQAQLLAYYGCDFFQGYYYAKPQNGESFLRLLEINMNEKKREE